MNHQWIMLSSLAASTCAVFGICSLAFDLVLRDHIRIRKRVRDQFGRRLANRPRSSSLFKDLSEPAADSATAERPGFWQKLETTLDQSGSRLSAPQFILISGALALFAAIAAELLARQLWIAAVAGALGAIAPFGYVAALRRRRLKKLYEQLPEAFDLMCRAVRAGQTMTSAMQLVASECEWPIADEFSYCCEQQNLGLPHEMALRDLANRNDVVELKMFVVALVVQRQSGGNPVETLDNLSLLMRKRTKLKEKVRALTSEGRMQALVLSVLPLVAFVAIFVLNREYVQVLLDRPKVLAGMICAQLLGTVWIRQIVAFDY